MEQHEADGSQPRPAASSPRSPKRQRSATGSPSSSGKKRRLSSNDGTVRDGTLRIVAETLRGENRQLLQDRDVLEREKKSLQDRLKQAQHSLRDLEDDMERVYRQQQKEMDAQRRGFEQKLQGKVRILQDSAGQQDAKDIRFPVGFSKQTTAEMDSFVQSCRRWQDRLAKSTNELAARTEKVAEQEVQGVLRDLVTNLEMQTLKSEMCIKEVQLQWATMMESDTASCLKELHTIRQDTEIFEAMEKQLMDDRVVELETQLAQKRAVEREKEMELSSLRADQEELMHSSHVVPNEEFETFVAEKKSMNAELKQLKEKVKHQTEELERVDEECASLKQHNQRLAEETRELREKQETSEFETTKQTMTQEQEFKKLQVQLQAAKVKGARMTAALNVAEREVDKSKQRKEELKILYAKFSSTMDSVSEKMMRLEELEQELKESQSNAREMQNQKEQLEKDVARLQQEQSDLSAAQDREKDSRSKVQKQYAELKELESQQKLLASNMQSEIAELKAQNEALKEQQVKKEHQSVGQPSNESDKQRIDNHNMLVVQVAEKEALQMFLQHYYTAAEEKCSKLLQQVSELEAQNMSIQEQTKESCRVLHMCTQVESCDESVRASLLDVMATLEDLT